MARIPTKTFNCYHHSEDQITVEYVAGKARIEVAACGMSPDAFVYLTADDARKMARQLLKIAAQEKPAPATPDTLSPQALAVRNHMQTKGSISAVEAMIDHNMTSATLARRIVDLERHGHGIRRERRVNKVTGRPYTRYWLTALPGGEG